MKKLKAKCPLCNDWGCVKQEAVGLAGNKLGFFIDVPCPKKCNGQRKSEDKWEYTSAQ